MVNKLSVKYINAVIKHLKNALLIQNKSFIYTQYILMLNIVLVNRLVMI